MSEYKITLPDGTEVEAPTGYEAIDMALCMHEQLNDKAKKIAGQTNGNGTCDRCNGGGEVLTSGLNACPCPECNE